MGEEKGRTLEFESGLHELDFTGNRIDGHFKKMEQGNFTREENNGDLMEEICDSESVLETAGTSSSTCNSQYLGRFNKLDDLFIADDAGSTTEDGKEEENSKEFGEPMPQSYIRYLQEASDDELGLPPNPQHQIGEISLPPCEFDLDFDVGSKRGKLECEDQALFWLSLLRS